MRFFCCFSCCAIARLAALMPMWWGGIHSVAVLGENVSLSEALARCTCSSCWFDISATFWSTLLGLEELATMVEWVLRKINSGTIVSQVRFETIGQHGCDEIGERVGGVVDVPRCGDWLQFGAENPRHQERHGWLIFRILGGPAPVRQPRNGCYSRQLVSLSFHFFWVLFFSLASFPQNDSNAW